MELAKVAVADQPILVDITAPFAGIVNDGDTFRTDQQFSKDADKVKYKYLTCKLIKIIFLPFQSTVT